MTNQCKGIFGKLFGHKIEEIVESTGVSMTTTALCCTRCGQVEPVATTTREERIIGLAVEIMRIRPIDTVDAVKAVKNGIAEIA